MGGRVNLVNDIQILREMLVGRAQVRLQQKHNRLSVELTDLQAGTKEHTALSTIVGV